MPQLTLEKLEKLYSPDPFLIEVLMYWGRFMTRPSVLLLGEYSRNDVEFLSHWGARVHLDEKAIEGQVDLVISFQYLNLIPRQNLRNRLSTLQEITAKKGMHAHRFILDYANAPLDKYTNYIPATLVQRQYQKAGFDIAYSQTFSDDPVATVFIAEKPEAQLSKKHSIALTDFLVTVGFASTIACVGAYMSPLHFFASSGFKLMLWPTYILNVFLAISLGGFGLVVCLTSSLFINASLYGLGWKTGFCFLGHLTQYGFVTWYYRKRIGRLYWTDEALKPSIFFLFGCFVPVILSSFFGALAFAKNLTLAELTRSYLNWGILTAPFVFLAIAPFLRPFVRFTNREGLSKRGWFGDF